MIQVYFLEGSAVGLSIVASLSAASIVTLKFLSWRFKTRKFFGLFAVHPEGLYFSSSSMADTFQDLEGKFWMLFGKTLCLFLCGFNCSVTGLWSVMAVSVNVVVWFHSVSCNFLL